MIPMLSSPVDRMKSKQKKLGFSIDSLVGRVSSSNQEKRGSSSPPSSSSPRSSPPSGFTRKSPDPNLNHQHDVWKPSALRFPDSLHPRFPSPILHSPSPSIPGMFAHGHGFGISPSVLPLAALLPPSQGFPNPALLNHVTSLGTPLPPTGAREFPSYPWLLSRHNRIFGHRFPGPEFPTFLLPFRKPKRIRTAFSPNQLLKLEQAFEKNQYVVGQERKQLAQSLNLSETQVKVWFQNRRTKHKRVVQDDDIIPDDGHQKDPDRTDKSSTERISKKKPTKETTKETTQGPPEGSKPPLSNKDPLPTNDSKKSSLWSENGRKIGHWERGECEGAKERMTDAEYDGADDATDEETDEEYRFQEPKQILGGPSFS